MMRSLAARRVRLAAGARLQPPPAFVARVYRGAAPTAADACCLNGGRLSHDGTPATTARLASTHRTTDVADDAGGSAGRQPPASRAARTFVMPVERPGPAAATFNVPTRTDAQSDEEFAAATLDAVQQWVRSRGVTPAALERLAASLSPHGMLGHRDVATAVLRAAATIRYPGDRAAALRVVWTVTHAVLDDLRVRAAAARARALAVYGGTKEEGQEVDHAESVVLRGMLPMPFEAVLEAAFALGSPGAVAMMEAVGHFAAAGVWLQGIKGGKVLAHCMRLLLGRPGATDVDGAIDALAVYATMQDLGATEPRSTDSMLARAIVRASLTTASDMAALFGVPDSDDNDGADTGTQPQLRITGGTLLQQSSAHINATPTRALFAALARPLVAVRPRSPHERHAAAALGDAVRHHFRDTRRDGALVHALELLLALQTAVHVAVVRATHHGRVLPTSSAAAVSDALTRAATAAWDDGQRVRRSRRERRGRKAHELMMRLLEQHLAVVKRDGVSRVVVDLWAWMAQSEFELSPTTPVVEALLMLLPPANAAAAMPVLARGHVAIGTEVIDTALHRMCSGGAWGVTGDGATPVSDTTATGDGATPVSDTTATTDAPAVRATPAQVLDAAWAMLNAAGTVMKSHTSHALVLVACRLGANEPAALFQTAQRREVLLGHESLQALFEAAAAADDRVLGLAVFDAMRSQGADELDAATLADAGTVDGGGVDDAMTSGVDDAMTSGGAQDMDSLPMEPDLDNMVASTPTFEDVWDAYMAAHEPGHHDT